MFLLFLIYILRSLQFMKLFKRHDYQQKLFVLKKKEINIMIMMFLIFQNQVLYSLYYYGHTQKKKKKLYFCESVK